MKTEVYLKPFQDKFLFSEVRYPALIAGIGTGKTYMLLLKIWRFCETYPNTLALIVRKEYTDLRDSTLKDFERYFGVTSDSNKEYHFANGSVIMFRHGGELNVLKNINLTIVGVEQAEEFDTDETFTYLRDRLRRDNAPYRQLCIIGNTRGHNWIWRLWKNNPQVGYDLTEATTFENSDNLPDDFIEDLKRMEKESPNHYRQYVANSWEEVEADDYLFTWDLLQQSMHLNLPDKSIHRVMGIDVARFGGDETVFTIIENKGISLWEQIFIEGHRSKDLMWTVGRAIDLRREFKIGLVVVDDDGVGGGVVDRLRESNIQVVDFKGAEKPKDEEQFGNRRAEGFFKLREMITNGYLKIFNNHELLDQLLTIRYKYTSKGTKLMISKDEMRKEGIKSPDKADALMMAVSASERPISKQEFNPYTNFKKVY